MSAPGSAKGGVMAEGSGFLGARIPVEIEEMARHIRDLDKELFRKILKGE